LSTVDRFTNIQLLTKGKIVMKSNQGFLNNSCKTHYGQVIVNRPLPGKDINEKNISRKVFAEAAIYYLLFSGSTNLKENQKKVV
jgi:hypothetical protein